MIKVVSVGSIKEKALKSLIEEYSKRLKGYTKLDFIEVADLMTNASNSDAENLQILKIEGERILSKIKDQEYVIVLDLKGVMLDSVGLSKKIQEIQTYHSSVITFVIGGSLGTSEAVKKRANFKWLLSDLTFPHQIVKLLLLEQVYRAYKINNNEPYHK